MRTITSSLLLLILLACASSCKKDNGTAACGSVPTGLSTIATSAGRYVQLRWAPVAGVSVYAVQYRMVGTSYWYGESTSTDTIYLTGLTPNSSYEWQVQSVCINGSSAFSASATFQTGNSAGSCSYDSLLYFYAATSVGNPSNKSLTAYQDSANYISFVFSSYPTGSATYRVVAPGSSTSGNTTTMTAVNGGGTTFVSTGTDSVFASITVTGGKLSLSLPKVKAANISNPTDTGYFYNVIINQQ